MQNLLQRKLHQRSSWSTVGSDFKEFTKDFRNFLKEISKENKREIILNKWHYFLSWFLKDNNDNTIYFSISDVRYTQNAGLNNILYRTAKDSKDFSWGWNNYSWIENLEDKLIYMFNKY